jgi:hypothetical protein
VIYLRVQLLAHVDGPGVLDLLRFPQASSDSKVTAHWWKRGIKSSMTGRDLDSVLGGIAVSGSFNHVEIDRTVSGPPTPTKPLLAVRAVLKVSPTSSAWDSPSSWPAGKGAAQQARASLESRELALRWNRISRHPTICDISCTLAEEPEGVSGEGWREWVGDQFPPALACHQVFGAADSVNPVFPGPDILERLAPWPRAYEELGSRLDDAHELLLGNVEYCESLQAMIAGATLVKVIACPGGLTSIAAVALSATARASIEGANPERYERWFVHSNPTLASKQPYAEAGELRVNSRIFRTSARLEQLEAARLLPARPPGVVYFPLLDAKYCALLGIDPSSMLVALWQESMVSAAKVEIDRRFAEASDDPLAERVWAAHAAVYARLLFTDRESLEFVRSYVFDRIRSAGSPKPD